MVLASPVCHPDNPDQDLLKRGFVLEDVILRRLREIGVGIIYVDYPGLDDLDKHLSVQLSPARQAVYSQIKESIQANQRQTRPSVSYTDYQASTRELVLTLVSQGPN